MGRWPGPVGDLVTSAFWHDRRVLVTGHTGFKGSWLVLWLKNLGADVAGLALPPTSERGMFDAARVDAEIDSTVGDIRDRKMVRSVLARQRPEIVFHLAAQPLVRRSYNDPVETFSTNVVGTATLLDELRAVDDLAAAVVVTSDKCYDNREWPWGYRESDPLGGADPYSASKACQEHVTAAFNRSYFVDRQVGLGTARAGNVVGGGDWSEDRLVPDVIAAFTDGFPVSLRHPEATRPWQHVLDPLAGYLQYAERLATAPQSVRPAYNFGPDDLDFWPVRRVVEHLAEVWGTGSWLKEPGEHPHEAQSLRLDSSCAMAELGWRPRLGTAPALEWTAAWYVHQAADADLCELSLQQVQEFESLPVSADAGTS